MFTRKKKGGERESAQGHSRIENLEQENERLRGIVERVRFIVRANTQNP